MLNWIKKSKCNFAKFIRQAGENYGKEIAKDTDRVKDTDRTVRQTKDHIG
jgi:hypothetical protein